MSELMNENQKIELAYRVLPKIDADIFCLHHFGDPHNSDPQLRIHWTYGQISRKMSTRGAMMSFSTISKSLKRSAPIMFEAARAFEALACVVEVAEGVAEADQRPDFRITLQFGHETRYSTDTTAKKALLPTIRRE